MHSFRDALELLLENTPLLATERCQIEQATGRVLRAEVRADRAVPPFDRVMMDGFALRCGDWRDGHRSFMLTGSAPAGQPCVELAGGAASCVEVMTGAPCPAGADGIIPVEEVLRRDGSRVFFAETGAPVAGRFLHRAGSDAADGQILLEAGMRLGSREIGVAASCGAASLLVSAGPKIAVVATGDELVAVDETPAAHQIRQSNGYSISAALAVAGFAARKNVVLGDDETAARPVFEALLGGHDWLVLTGAVSKGGRDFVPAVLKALGCRRLFHGVTQRPGKPAGCWLGSAGQVIVALPGNPVSALTGLHAFVLPALAVASGLPLPVPRLVPLDGRVSLLPDFTWHLPVKLRADGRAEVAATGNSGDFIGLLGSDGFLTLPPASGNPVTAPALPFTAWL